MKIRRDVDRCDAPWSQATATSTRLHATGGEPVVQNNGDVVVPILANSGLVAFRSVNGGRTWGPAIKVASIFQHRFGGNLRGPFFPSVATDRAGRIYITWPDRRFRPSCASNDMVLTTSADGVHWTRVTRIPVDPLASAVDHLGGGLGVGREPAVQRVMYQPSGGAVVAGGTRSASPAGAHSFGAAGRPGITR